jgi:hypothetical protein
MFSWAMREGLVEANPVIGTNRTQAKVDRVFDLQEIGTTGVSIRLTATSD